MSKEQDKSDACDWLENLEGDAWADACEEIAGAVKRQAGGAQDDRPEFERQFNMTGWHIDESYRSGSSYKYQEQRMAFDAWKIARAALAQPSPSGEFGDAYQGAREDLAIWKRRALEAEQALREEKILTERLGNALNDENGPTFMGEPNVEQPSPAPELDFAKPLETASGEPVKWICSDVIEYKSARVCVDQNTGLVYSSPYIGLKIRNVMPAPELERPEVVAVLVLGGVFDGVELGDNDIVTVNPAIERLQAALVTDGEVLVELMTVAQHERIEAARVAEIEEMDGLVKRLGDLLSELAVALRGPEPPLTRYGYADLPLRVKTLLEERDVDLAKLAAMEQQEPVAWVTETDPEVTMGRGINWFPKNVAKLPVGTKLYAAPVAQAGQVPEGWRIERAPDGALCVSSDDGEHRAFFSPNGHRTARVIAAFLDAMLAAVPQPAGGK